VDRPRSTKAGSTYGRALRKARYCYHQRAWHMGLASPPKPVVRPPNPVFAHIRPGLAADDFRNLFRTQKSRRDVFDSSEYSTPVAAGALHSAVLRMLEGDSSLVPRRLTLLLTECLHLIASLPTKARPLAVATSGSQSPQRKPSGFVAGRADILICHKCTRHTVLVTPKPCRKLVSRDVP